MLRNPLVPFAPWGGGPTPAPFPAAAATCQGRGPASPPSAPPARSPAARVVFAPSPRPASGPLRAAFRASGSGARGARGRARLQPGASGGGVCGQQGQQPSSEAAGGPRAVEAARGLARSRPTGAAPAWSAARASLLRPPRSGRQAQAWRLRPPRRGSEARALEPPFPAYPSSCHLDGCCFLHRRTPLQVLQPKSISHAHLQAAALLAPPIRSPTVTLWRST